MKAIVLSSSNNLLFTRSWLVLLLLFSAAARPAGMQALGAESYAGIEKTYAGHSFLVALWSLDCPPCMKELEMLERVHRAYPDFKIVLINTDGVEASEEAEALLEQYELNSADTWIFAPEETEKLRFSIDRQWYGELPRSYLYRDNARQSHSGLIDEAQLRNWLDSLTDR
ncbi:MAG: TlpA family protein disulfide reductase [Halioglobus sp.]